MDETQAQENPTVILPTEIYNISGFIDTLDIAPTHKPGKFWDSIKIALGTLYIFDRKNNQWINTGSKKASGVGSKGANSGTGDLSITCGFQPTMVKITAYPSGNNTTLSIGTHDTSTTTLFKYKSGANYVSSTDTAYLILVWDDATSANTEATFVSFDADGFTINWYTDDVGIVYLWEAYG